MPWVGRYGRAPVADIPVRFDLCCWVRPSFSWYGGTPHIMHRTPRARLYGPSRVPTRPLHSEGGRQGKEWWCCARVYSTCVRRGMLSVGLMAGCRPGLGLICGPESSEVAAHATPLDVVQRTGRCARRRCVGKGEVCVWAAVHAAGREMRDEEVSPGGSFSGVRRPPGAGAVLAETRHE